MHFSCEAKPGHHHDTKKKLRSKLNGFCHEKNPVFSFKHLQPRYTNAVVNAIQALKERSAEGQTHGDPSTTVHLLTERIRTFSKRRSSL
jgi:hypothetical protein